jgi:cytochrome c553
MPYKDKNERKRKAQEYSREHYLRNRAEILIKTAEKKKTLRAEWNVFKCTLKCAKCGFNHPAALDFHHEDPSKKDREVSWFIKNHQYAKAKEEVQKCIVLCANCHRIHHYEENSVKIQPLATNQLPEHAGKR